MTPRERAAILQLTENQREVYLTLASCTSADGWRTPMQIGGRDQSHHARTLMQLVKLGIVETKKLHAIYCSTRSTAITARTTSSAPTASSSA